MDSLSTALWRCVMALGTAGVVAAVGLWRQDWTVACLAMASIGMFIIGAFSGHIMQEVRAERERRKRKR